MSSTDWMLPTVSQWLEQLALTQYTDSFKQQAITSKQLQQLTDNDLINIGVPVLGHRLRMLESIAKQPSDSTSASPVKEPSKPKTERRQLTVMFCDLADSTRLAKTLDPEDLREVIRSYQRTAEQVVQRYGGHIAQYLGDGLMVYFGYPAAHEDDAIRAAYSTLELPSAIRKLNADLINRFDIELSVRTGVSTGDVVVGHIGNEMVGDALATGVTPNEAAHLQQLAENNSNVISKKTKELIGGRFAVKPLVYGDSPHAKVSDEKRGSTCELFQIIGVTDAESRFSAGKKFYHTEMIGRNDQLEELNSLWTDALNGHFQTALVTGEAGIGKSRMVQSLIESIDEFSYHRIVYQCSPYHTDTPFYPAVQQLAFAAKLSTANSEDEKLARIESLLAPLISNAEEAIALLSPLLRLNEFTIESKSENVLSAQQKRDATMEVFLSLLLGLTATRPVLFVLEDAHWIDATTQTLIDIATQRMAKQQILILLTARPEFNESLGEQSNFHNIDLPRLTEGATKQVVHQLSNFKSIPQEVMQQIISRTDGVPLFVEELTRTLLDSNLLLEHENDYELQRHVDDVHIPSTLQDSLMARLDKMDDVKNIAQIAACIGRDFHVNDITEVIEISRPGLKDAILRLESAQIVYRSSEDNYTFKHALVRDVAYASLPRNKRKSIHQHLFEHYSSKGRQSEVLAFHASEAGLTEQAMRHWSTAASTAIERAAYREAIAHLDKAIICTNQLEDNVTTRTNELELLVQQGHASTALKGFAHPDTVNINVKARALLGQVKHSPYRYPVLYGHWVINFAIGQHTSALTDANEMLHEATNADDRVQRIIAYRALASSQTMMGEFQEADQNLAKVIDLYDAKQDKSLAWQINLDPTVPGRIYRALCKTCMGDAGAAAELTKDVERFAMDLGHSHTIIYMLSHMALTGQVGRWANREHFINLTKKFVKQHDLMAYLGHALGIEAMMLYEKGELDTACETMQRSLEVITKTKTFIYSPLLYANYAAILADLNRLDEAGRAAETALTMSTRNKELWARSEILRLVAHAEYKQLHATGHGSFDDVETRLRESITLADSQGTHMWSLRSTTSLAALQHELGNSRQAHAALQARLNTHPSSGKSQLDWKLASNLLDQLDDK